MAASTRPSNAESWEYDASGVRRDSVCVFRDGHDQLRVSAGCTPRVTVLVIALTCRLETGNRVYASCASLCRHFGFPYTSTLKAWHWLERHDYLRAFVNDYGQTVYWKLSPYLAWKGRPSRVRIARRIWDAEGELTRLAAQWKE